MNEYIIDWLGWRAAFQFSALTGFVILAICILIFEEPERGRFDINNSVVVNPDQSMKTTNIGYQLSEDGTFNQLKIKDQGLYQGPAYTSYITEYFWALKELFTNDTANWILLAACLRTLQGIAMTSFNTSYFSIYDEDNPDIEYIHQMWSQIAGLVGTFICTMGTAIICDRYDNYNYMTKAYVCIFCTFVSIPCCMMIYLCTTNYAFSMFGLVVEYTLSTGWGQPAIGILSTVCDPSVRGTAVSMFFFLTTIFSVIAPNAFHAVEHYYGLHPKHETEEFGRMICAFTVIPCILAIPCFYIAGVKYSWYKYHEAMFMLDVWGEMEQWYQDDISKKRFMQMQMNPDAGDPANLSVSVDWKLIREQRKMKIKHFKKEAIDF